MKVTNNKVTSSKISDNRIGGGSSSIGAGSGDKSPDWDVKWPDGDAKDIRPGV